MAHHGAGLRKLLSLAGRSHAEAVAFVGALERSPLEAPGQADAAMLGYAIKLTQTPAAVRKEDVAALREAGFDDRAIHDICAVVAYYAFVNRMADGLGVELEGRFGTQPDEGASEPLTGG